MKAVILVRVSTKEQEEGHSLNAQHQRLKEYCARRGLDVIRTFEIIESSTTGTRRQFNAMLDFANKQRETIAIVADAVDRVQRSFKESVQLDEMIRKESIELHFYREGMVIGKGASATDIMRWDFSVMGAKSYVLQLTENVKRSIEWKLRNGEWISVAPIGYRNIRDPRTSKSAIVIDDTTAHLVQRLFKEYASGSFTIGEMRARAKSWGLVSRSGTPFSKSRLHLMLQSPFYYGEMLVNGKIYPHNYPPLVSREIWEDCQAVRLGWSKKPFRYSEKDFLFRGLITCGVTGRMVWSDTKKGTYTYLIAADPENPGKRVFVREEEVEKQVAEIFRGFYVPPETLNDVLYHLKGSNEAEKEFHRAEMGRLQGELTRATDRYERLTELLLDRVLSAEDYETQRQKIAAKRNELLEGMKKYQQVDDTFSMMLGNVITMCSRAYEIYQISSNAEKRELINLLFSNLKLNGKTLDYSLRSPFNHLFVLTKSGEWWARLDAIRTMPDMRDSVLKITRSNFFINFSNVRGVCGQSLHG